MREYQLFLEGKHYLNKTIPVLSKYRPVAISATDYSFNPEIWRRLSVELTKQGAATAEASVAMPVGRGRNVTDIPTYLKMKELSVSNGLVEEDHHMGLRNCGLVLRYATVDPDGGVRLCALFPTNGSALLGNMFKEGKDLFKKPSVTKYYYMPSPSNKLCGACKLEEYCNDCIFNGLYANKEECTYKKEIGA